ncbi:hypothetical protein NEOLI_005465 [Neolecta irregularis DAH-3]|uniref:Uncharacterized protein n=1 Tax=Neolecta irregularis (strain DAH-3) TaxID=1198029 RepID=A0A1U7LQV2_NEOID|nr:hypothetical protein NEOLI_005465 [Neolecta irregularis DAH-3]|eukprot:OLL24932.1 hypothetical protein NEOLI_005465 [Neolecta irregularis DAH-3]
MRRTGVTIRSERYQNLWNWSKINEKRKIDRVGFNIEASDLKLYEQVESDERNVLLKYRFERTSTEHFASVQRLKRMVPSTHQQDF